jgi:hypothetical protein
MFRWTDDKHIRARTYDELVWRPALFYAGVIAEPKTDRRGRRQYVSSRENGMHALRHYFASITLADGVNIKELAEYLGHRNPKFTLRLYTHMLPSSHERARKAVDSRLSRLFSLKSHGAGRRTLPHDLLGAGRRPVPQPTSNQPLTCANSYLMRMPEIARAITKR